MFGRLRWVWLVVCAVCLAGSAHAQSAAPVTKEYRMRPGDVVSINVWGYSDFNVPNVPVRPDGKLSYPSIGEIYVVDQTPAWLGRVIAQGLSRYVRNARVTVTLISSNAEKYFVTGSVGRAGEFNLTTGTGVREAIAAAGDLNLDANDQAATLLRNGQRIPVDLGAAMRGEASANLPLQPGDTLAIEKALVTFIGAVNITGPQPLRRGATLNQALAAVGGVRESADMERVQVLRGTQTIVANLRDITTDPSKDVPLQPGDIVKVDIADERAEPVFIIGNVGRRGMIRYLPGRRDTLQDAINMAGGVTGDADLARVKVRRVSPNGESTETAYDLRTLEGREVRLQPNDYIEVPRKRRGPATNIVTGAVGLLLSVYGIFRR